MSHCISIRRAKQTTTLKLSGMVDIFDAGSLLNAAREAVSAPPTDIIHLNLTAVTRLDVTAYQIIRALCSDSQLGGRTVRVSPPPIGVLEKWKRLGLNWFDPSRERELVHEVTPT